MATEMIAEHSNMDYLVPAGKLRCFLTGEHRDDTPEENVRQRWLRSLVEEYGYPKEAIALEAGIVMGRARKRADIAIHKHGREHLQENIVVLVEVKRDDVLPSDGSRGLDQLKSYMAACASCRHGLWAGRQRHALEQTDDGEFEERADIPRFGSDTIRPPTHRDLKPAHELSSVFRRCHSYIYANAGLQKEEAFKEFLKLIFCKTWDEQETTGDLLFSVTAQERDNESGQRRLVEDRLTPLFEDVCRSYPYIFDRVHDAIRLESSVAAYMVAELQYLSIVNTQADVKGAAYEELVGANMRGDRGEFFTPRNVCDMAVRMVMALHPEDRLTSLRVVDCCCGTGGFLVSWVNNLLEVLIDQERSRGSESPEQRARERLRDVCGRNLFGIDINPFLVQTCQMNLVMHGDGSSNVYRENSVKRPGEWGEKARNNVPCGSMDLVLTNPPFGGKARIEDTHTLDQYELPGWDRRARSRFMAAEELHIEAAMRFLKPNGHLAIVLPRGILNNPGKRYLRSWLLQRSQIVAVVDLPTTTFASSRGINHPSVVIARKFDVHEQRQADAGQLPKDYDAFMAMPTTAGINRRAKPIYQRHPDGRELHDENGERLRDDQIAAVAGKFKEWVESRA